MSMVLNIIRILTLGNKTRNTKLNIKNLKQKQQQHKQKQSQLPESFDDTNTETIDLTQTNKTVIKQSVLLTDSSIQKLFVTMD